jgi:sulfur-carrier protein
MQLHVRLFADLIQAVPEAIRARYSQQIRSGSSLELVLPDGYTVADLLEYLALPSETAKIIFVNGRVQGRDCRLESGDEVGLFPLIGGG